jgi:hypothetical protein
VSIHHYVSIHCDNCGHWEDGDQSTTRKRRQAGWDAWRSQNGEGSWRHLCPRCTGRGVKRGEVSSSPFSSSLVLSQRMTTVRRHAASHAAAP